MDGGDWSNSHMRWTKAHQVVVVFLVALVRSPALLENKSSEPVEEVLRHRFYNRYPQTETIGLSLGHRVFHPVP